MARAVFFFSSFFFCRREIAASIIHNHPGCFVTCFFYSCMRDGLRQQADWGLGFTLDARCNMASWEATCHCHANSHDIAWGHGQWHGADAIIGPPKWLSPTVEGIPMGFWWCQSNESVLSGMSLVWHVLTCRICAWCCTKVSFGVEFGGRMRICFIRQQQGESTSEYTTMLLWLGLDKRHGCHSVNNRVHPYRQYMR